MSTKWTRPALRTFDGFRPVGGQHCVVLIRVYDFPVVLPEGPHPIPSRTRKLSPPGPMVLHGSPCGRVGRRRSLFPAPAVAHSDGGLPGSPRATKKSVDTPRARA